MGITDQQTAAIEASGKVIVSAAAGSGKTFVMIQKLVTAIENGVDLDSVLAVTFTKKAAAQMKEKLRRAIIERIAELNEEIKKGVDAEENGKACIALKNQLSKVATADISTIHSFCARTLRTYFYAIDIDGTFDIIASDDAQAKEYKRRAVNAIFERYYEGDDKNSENFKTLLSFYRRGRRDDHLKDLIFSAYEEMRKTVNYTALLDRAETLFTDEGFKEVCASLTELNDEKYIRIISEIKEFANGFSAPQEGYHKILEEMLESFENLIGCDPFEPKRKLYTTAKPRVSKNAVNEADEEFKEFRDRISGRYDRICKGVSDRMTERERFINSGIPTRAFASVMKDFDEEYTAVKREENKLDYNDLEHLILKLFENEEIAKEIKSKYSCVFVDEYQDVNPVQEKIIASIGGDSVFLVGDIKQAIYGFRGSESKHFREKFIDFDLSEGRALRLPNNFRSSDGVLNFVNTLFSSIMTDESCGINYSSDGWMKRGGLYPNEYGYAQIHIFGKDESEDSELGVYSLKGRGKSKRTREARAVLEIVKKELNSRHYDVKKGEMVDTKPGDICILTRKFKARAQAIIRALQDEGYSVAGAQGESIGDRPEVKRIKDILSYIDNKQQDIPLVTSLLSPLGGLTHEELATIKVQCKDEKGLSFRDCCKHYIMHNRDELSEKLRSFRVKIEKLRSLAEVLTASEMIDRILEDTYLEAEYCKGEQLKNIRRFAEEGKNISVSALLAKLKNGYEIKSPASASSDSIKVMTMHASKGLEFPVVIISDICASFRGALNEDEVILSKQFGFALKSFDRGSMLTYETILRKLIKSRNQKDDLQNELNLFYVACTRAMCNLHILAEERTTFNPAQSATATNYADLFDMEPFAEEMGDLNIVEEDGENAVPTDTKMLEGMLNPELYERLNSRFNRGYAGANSVNLPVKSSASAILKMGEEDTVCTKQLFGGEEEPGTERGIAYHRFLELCDFDIKDKKGIEGEKESFLQSGKISKEQYELLDADTLTEILNIPIFGTLNGATLYREQEFLCRLPANEIMDTTAPDKVLIQGAIDLLAKTPQGYKIIDYKYSHKNEEQLKSTYSRQLALYKKAVSRITRTAEKDIETIIVNIFLKQQINL